jgi:hypothetical protein
MAGSGLNNADNTRRSVSFTAMKRVVKPLTEELFRMFEFVFGSSASVRNPRTLSAKFAEYTPLRPDIHYMYRFGRFGETYIQVLQNGDKLLAALQDEEGDGKFEVSLGGPFYSGDNDMPGGRMYVTIDIGTVGSLPRKDAAQYYANWARNPGSYKPGQQRQLLEIMQRAWKAELGRAAAARRIQSATRGFLARKRYMQMLDQHYRPGGPGMTAAMRRFQGH